MTIIPLIQGLILMDPVLGRPMLEEDKVPDDLIFARRVDDMGAQQGAVQVVDNAYESWVQESHPKKKAKTGTQQGQKS